MKSWKEHRHVVWVIVSQVKSQVIILCEVKLQGIKTSTRVYPSPSHNDSSPHLGRLTMGDRWVQPYYEAIILCSRVAHRCDIILKGITGSSCVDSELATPVLLAKWYQYPGNESKCDSRVGTRRLNRCERSHDIFHHNETKPVLYWTDCRLIHWSQEVLTAQIVMDLVEA